MRSNPILLAFVLIVLSCAARETLVPLEPVSEYERAMSLFDKKQYQKAAEAFERILFYYPSSEYVDDAQYWLSRAYLEMKDYDQAVIEFNYLIRNFPNSALVEQAHFYRAKANLLGAPSYEKDLSDLKRAIQLFDEFLTRYPNSEYTDEARKEILTARNLLAKKELENGKLYEKLKEPEAALLYYEYIRNNYPETESAGEATYRRARILEKQGQFEEALELYKELLEDENWQKRAADRIADLEKNS
ncbi:MAG: outer membrane protein assembly factor BamD [candidate division WOR-3 bacterium]|nr:outer membrane protein assembly factor BamD [candidate division WOR-3 bacterium]